MKAFWLTAAITPFCLAAPALAETARTAVDGDAVTQPQATAAPKDADTVTTGVAKGRDRLDSATSTSSLHEADIAKLAPRSIGELMRDIPGVRSEASTGEGNASFSIRGLPIASSGAKFVQLQEDGLPVLEFGDFAYASADIFLRPDLSLGQVDVIRGGSASTFASNSPGGIINFISKTGEREGGAVALTGGLDYRQYRVDADYGLHLSDTLRMNVGGFYRQGEGPLTAGYDAQRGGQIKANVTKTFPGGYVRVYGKYLDDRTPYYDSVPLRVTGTDRNPVYSPVANFDPTRDALLSRYLNAVPLLDKNNNYTVDSLHDGEHAKVRSIGVEAQFGVHGWTVIEKFRYAAISGTVNAIENPAFLPASALAAAFGGPGATLAYGGGPLAGTPITNPATLNGNGLLGISAVGDAPITSLDNITNDIRASRTWSIGRGELTTTGGVYASRQTLDRDLLWDTQVFDILGGGRSAPVDIIAANGTKLTTNGVYSYDLLFLNGAIRRRFRVDYDTLAPFGSVNYHLGKVAIGGSLRYDIGHAHGSVASADLGGGRVGLVARDLNGDGIVSPPETLVNVTPLDSAAPVNYRYGYLSYSAGINYRVTDPFALFARYSRGARANADKILFSPAVSAVDGSLLIPDAVVDPVRQAEVGAKFRKSGLTLNLTGFWAKAQDTNIDLTTGAPIARLYRAIGAEFEGGYHAGIFGLTASATYTDATIDRDANNPAVVGQTPRHQPDVIFQATPQIMTDRFSVGAVVIGTTGSYAQDVNLLRIPGYVTTNAFVQVRLTGQVQLSVNAANLFGVQAITSVDANTVPATGVVAARLLNGRTVSATVRFDFR